MSCHSRGSRLNLLPRRPSLLGESQEHAGVPRARVGIFCSRFFFRNVLTKCRQLAARTTQEQECSANRTAGEARDGAAKILTEGRVAVVGCEAGPPSLDSSRMAEPQNSVEHVEHVDGVESGITFDTGLDADAVEFCPRVSFHRWAAVGTYKLRESQDGEGIAPK